MNSRYFSQFRQAVIAALTGLVAASVFFVLVPMVAEAATLSITPSTGVYQSGNTFSASVVVNSQGQSINAADGTLSFNPSELSVVSVSRAGSIFNFWPVEPTFSNSNGQISFGGGLPPPGFTGSRGVVMNITFRAKGSGTSKVTFTEGSVLANDGRGSNVLSSYGHGSYTIQTASVAPEPEVIVEYVPPTNTPGRPVISSATHEDQDLWYAKNEAKLSWSLPAGVTTVRTLLDRSPSSIPTKVYETPIESITLSDLDEGVQYFHLQFRNDDGWGTVAHYRLAVDTKRPTALEITQPDADFTNPEQILTVSTKDETSGVAEYLVKIDDTEPFTVEAAGATGTIALPSLSPGYHSVVVEARDAAGNMLISNYSFTIEAFEKPEFSSVPAEVPSDVIPVFKGQSRPNSTVTITLQRIGASPVEYEVQTNERGEFNFIPESALATGVYEIQAVAVDEFGAQSEMSDALRFAVQEPGFVRIGTFVVSILSILIPLVGLVVLLVLMLLFVWRRIKRFRKGVQVESAEAFAMAQQEFAKLQTILKSESETIADSRKTKKLTKAEAEMIETLTSAVAAAEKRIEKEITDVQDLTDSK